MTPGDPLSLGTRSLNRQSLGKPDRTAQGPSLQRGGAQVEGSRQHTGTREVPQELGAEGTVLFAFAATVSPHFSTCGARGNVQGVFAE